MMRIFPSPMNIYLKKLGNLCLSSTFRHSSSNTSYLVLLPEVPEDSADNPILADMFIPNFDKINIELCYKGVGLKSLEYENTIWNIEKRIQEDKDAITFENLINELEKLEDSLSNTWNIAKALFTVKNNKFSTSSYMKIHNRAKKARACKYQNQIIYKTCKDIYKKDDSLNEIQKRVLQKFILEARLNGLDLNENELDVLRHHLKELDTEQKKYFKNLKDCSKLFSYRVIDKEVVSEWPTELRYLLSNNKNDPDSGPWTITHSPTTFKEFMKHCPDADLRFNAWSAYVALCSPRFDAEHSNYRLVEVIRECRRMQATTLGYKTYADLSMETKMASSVQSVLDVIGELYDKAKQRQIEEIASLKALAAESGEKNEFRESDVPYWRNQQLLKTSAISEDHFRKLFPFDHVWSHLLALCSNLFGIYFELVPKEASSAWHEDVLLYNVFDQDGKHISSFYIDPYRRNSEKIMTTDDPGIHLPLKRTSLTNPQSLSLLSFNFDPPDPASKKSYLTLENVEALFKRMGHILPYVLSTVKYGSVSGLTNVEWDAMEMSANFMINWLYEPTMLEKLCDHVSGVESKQNCVESILARKNHLAGYDLCRELFLSHFDLKLHTEKAHWHEILQDLYPKYNEFKIPSQYSLPCWFTPIMASEWPAAYFCHFWSKMIAADVFLAFKECPPREVAEVGRRLRETFLSTGGGLHSAQLFRLFRGRDPMPIALHQIIGL